MGVGCTGTNPRNVLNPYGAVHVSSIVFVWFVPVTGCLDSGDRVLAFVLVHNRASCQALSI